MDELQKKLETYQNQLYQVKELLAVDPDNDQFLKLEEDLQEVIKLTEDLIGHQQQPQVPPPPPPRPDKDAPEPEPDPVFTEPETNGQAAPVVDEGPSTVSVVQAAPQPVAAVVEAAPTASVAVSMGKRYEIMNNDRWYPVAIKSVSGAQANIYYLGHGAEDTIDIRVAELREIPPLEGPPPPDPHTLGPGIEVVGKYSGDGKLYEATIEEVTDFGYKLVFDAYGNSEEVPLEYIQPRAKGVEGRKFGEQEEEALDLRKKDRVTKDFRIPDNLRVLPTDSHAEKMRKRQKVKAIKSKFRQKEKAEEASAKQKSWQSFMTKGKRKKTGFMNAASRESIFKSPETVDGKVGVTGSDKKMTQYDDRKKFRFAGAGEDPSI
mmetsp:Transcript_5201/g.7206  ORF Transcript_5201/g.7206 Transcript_5201/m.7206 type:complete len:376 (+) Transcript_5201:40-1167(+)